MIRKEDAILVLQGLLNEENGNKINIYIERLREMSDDQWQELLKSKSINSVEQIEKIIDELTRRDVKIKLNDLISYGISGDTLHIHLVPSDLHNMLS